MCTVQDDLHVLGSGIIWNVTWNCGQDGHHHGLKLEFLLKERWATNVWVSGIHLYPLLVLVIKVKQ